MARPINKLTARTVDAAKAPGRFNDGGGLYLQVSKTGAKSWLFRYMLDGRSREMGLGSVLAVSLSKARERAAQCRALLADRVDPIEARQKALRLNKVAASNAISFEEAAYRYIELHEPGWRNPKSASQWRNTLKTYAFPIAGDLQVSEITTQNVLKILEPIWFEKHETARRLRGRIEKILSWAKVNGYCEGDNPAQWHGHLQNALPGKERSHKVKHHSAMPYEAVKAFISTLQGKDGMSARALEFLIYTAARTSEVLGAKWSEIDLSKAIWTIPAIRTKTESEHRVPLCLPALAVLKDLKSMEVSGFVFPADNHQKPLSNMAMLQLLRRNDIDYTVHGFRSSLRDWAAEQTNAPREVAEQALGHALQNKVEAAYLRTDLFEKRRDLMNQWGGYLTNVLDKAASHQQPTNG